MIATRLGTFLLLAVLATAQQTAPSKSAKSSIPEPKLPVIDYGACPGEVPHWKIERNDRMYSSFRDKRTMVGTLKAGEEVTTLTGVNVIGEPDRALIKQSGAKSLAQVKGVSLKPGDAVLRYGFNSDGTYELWAKGVWFTHDDEVIAEKGDICGFGDKDQCTIVIIKDGVREWWVEVKTSSGRTGWVLAGKSTRGALWGNINFGELCGD
jgi:hypothetical protein